VFIHGFGGAAEATWGRFPTLLAAHASLSRWDIHSIGYASTLRVDVPHVWTADPPLELVSLSLRTALTVAPLNRYRAITLVAHSMGGLVAQHALLDAATVGRVAHLVLFGTPSNGLGKALLGGVLKRQLRDMEPGGEFITTLRSAWTDRYSTSRPFLLRVVAGERDEFVPGSSSLAPFPVDVQRAVPGNHLSIVKPESAGDRSVQIVVDLLCGDHAPIANVDSAAMAVERNEFATAVRVLLPLEKEIDEGALVQLALALEGLGRGPEALGLLEARFRERGLPTTDAYGVLAGRVKRRWLVERRENDWTRSRGLYEQALRVADPGYAGDGGHGRPVDVDQAMYHAINIAFLDLMRSNRGPQTAQPVGDMALRARGYAEASQDRLWSNAVLGDAFAMLGDLDAACSHYQAACSLHPKPRDVQSMYSQALRIAEHTFGRKGIEAIERAFRVTTL
jgi:pimeloyl-ACP methyl ester carboxylesterase